MAKESWWQFSAGLAIGAFIGCLVAAKVIRHEHQPGSQELKLSVHNLKRLDGQDSPQLREYFKGRIYALVSQGNRSQWVDDKIDYGPLDRKLLRSLSVVKGPESDEDLYRLAMEAAQGHAQKGVTADDESSR